MLEILKEQFNSGKALTQNKYQSSIKKENWAKYYWDMYPLNQDYYHEFNPVFLFNLYKEDFFKFTPVLTVRDGYLTFATFILNNFMTFSRYESNLFLIHEDLAPLVPPNITQHFGIWKRVQNKQTTLKNAKHVIIFGFICDQYVGPMEELRENLKFLHQIHPETTISLYLPIRRNVFEINPRESIATHIVFNMIKDLIPEREVKLLTGENFFDITDFKDTYIFDLAYDNFMVSDNYLHWYAQSRGATINNKSLITPPKDSLFSFELSLYHEFHVTTFPKVKSLFMDLLFYKKQNPSVKDYTFDPQMHGLLRDLLRIKA
jgi:hypothetical protein